MEIRLTCEETFDAAHFLPDYQGPCSVMHGHRWRVRFTVVANGVCEETGMVVDFKLLKLLVREFDHCNLNKKFDNPTAENIAMRLIEQGSKIINLHGSTTVKVESVEIWETPTSKVEIRV